MLKTHKLHGKHSTLLAKCSICVIIHHNQKEDVMHCILGRWISDNFALYLNDAIHKFLRVYF